MSGERRPLVEGEDYYFEGQFLVFTEKYLRDRGYCCENGCRHCPYGYLNRRRGDQPDESEASDE
ncbi:MAG TPA: DUF5522 domain-containing protein [Thermoanaerobaculia bacterium]|nr:DUF5522 domain-containing protein [Thermoanaerobaculia bacterium]